jgi:hypothetical protein
MGRLIVLAIIVYVCYVIYKKNQRKQQTETAAANGEATPQDLGRLRKTTLNRKWKTINSWSSLIGGAQGKNEILFNNVKKLLTEVGVPNIDVDHRNICLSGISGMFAGGRRQLVIENNKLKGYNVFVSIEDYGKQLNVSWYLMLRTNWLTNMLKLVVIHPFSIIIMFPVVIFAKIFYSSTGTTIPELMNVFDVEELTAFTTTVHHAVTGAVEAVMKGMDMDFSKVDTKARGFLNIS